MQPMVVLLVDYVRVLFAQFAHQASDVEDFLVVRREEQAAASESTDDDMPALMPGTTATAGNESARRPRESEDVTGDGSEADVAVKRRKIDTSQEHSDATLPSFVDALVAASEHAGAVPRNRMDFDRALSESTLPENYDAEVQRAVRDRLGPNPSADLLQYAHLSRWLNG
eukprot:Opistho-1_new@11387